MKWSLIFYLSLLLLCFGGNSAQAQRFIQLEKVNSLKVRKYYIGDELTFRLKNDEKYWYTEAIEDILVDKNLLLLNKRVISLDSVDAIRSFHPQSWSKPVSRSLYVFGAAWGVLTVATLPTGREAKVSDAIIGGSAIGLGYLIDILFRKKTWYLGKRRRLRALDINVVPFNIGP